MFKEYRQLPRKINFALLIVLGFVSCKNKYNGTFEVITCYLSNEQWPCILKKDHNNYFIIKEIRRYNEGRLTQYEGCASEGKYIMDFGREYEYSTEDEQVKQLLISRRSDTVLYFGKAYPIIRESRDSVFVKSRIKDEYYVFVGKIPFAQFH